MKLLDPILISTFSTILFAELGDKTQLATVAISGKSDKPIAVFIGSSSALVIACLIGTLAGGSISTYIPSYILKLVAAIGFLYIGVSLLLSAYRSQET
ncbi:TMEM165/GDT1 family protein [Prochlorococcus marinus]|uniref:GDT1 family protein n=1 Tax=Prochlorococcus marinus (strain MIT 9211) TaxID=93059 RepID=A9BAI3_PROM4|nr:TMEM165/GDT1 family protein [Prochlorococcus marinus]ABX08845.1 conserved hypothetical protein [Prochlorococcus marinus str. MIT 9211]